MVSSFLIFSYASQVRASFYFTPAYQNVTSRYTHFELNEYGNSKIALAESASIKRLCNTTTSCTSSQLSKAHLDIRGRLRSYNDIDIYQIRIDRQSNVVINSSTDLSQTHHFAIFKATTDFITVENFGIGTSTIDHTQRDLNPYIFSDQSIYLSNYTTHQVNELLEPGIYYIYLKAHNDLPFNYHVTIDLTYTSRQTYNFSSQTLRTDYRGILLETNFDELFPKGKLYLRNQDDLNFYGDMYMLSTDEQSNYIFRSKMLMLYDLDEMSTFLFLLSQYKTIMDEINVEIADIEHTYKIVEGGVRILVRIIPKYGPYINRGLASMGVYDLIQSTILTEVNNNVYQSLLQSGQQFINQLRDFNLWKASLSNHSTFGNNSNGFIANAKFSAKHLDVYTSIILEYLNQLWRSESNAQTRTQNFINDFNQMMATVLTNNAVPLDDAYTSRTLGYTRNPIMLISLDHRINVPSSYMYQTYMFKPKLTGALILDAMNYNVAFDPVNVGYVNNFTNTNYYKSLYQSITKLEKDRILITNKNASYERIVGNAIPSDSFLINHYFNIQTYGEMTYTVHVNKSNINRLVAGTYYVYFTFNMSDGSTRNFTKFYYVNPFYDPGDGSIGYFNP